MSNLLNGNLKEVNINLFKKFEETEESDYDYRIFERIIKGQFNRKRLWRLKRWARINSWRNHCGCEHDCCGCQCGQSYNLDYLPGIGIKLTITQSYNY